MLLLLALPAPAGTLDPSDASVSFLASDGFDSFAWAGDLDGDGLDDLVGGSEGGGTGRALVYLSPIGAQPDQSFVTGATFGPALGYMVTGAGDVDGDGYDDLAVSSAHDGVAAGEVYLLHGGPTGVDPVPGAILSDGSRSFGAELGAIGDANGDGFDDLAVGDTVAGTVAVFLGSAAGLEPVPAITLVGTAPWGRVRGVRDLNGDGYDDFAVGTQWYGYPTTLEVYYGGPNGPAATPDVTLVGPEGFGQTFDAGDFDGDGATELAVFSDEGFDDQVWIHDWTGSGPVLPAASLDVAVGGQTLVSAGDVDGDGDEELLLMGGDAWLYPGGPAGPSATPALVVDYGAPWRQTGRGDADGNGLDDVVVSAILNSAYLFLSWPDQDGDGAAWGGTVPPDCDDGDAEVHPGAPEGPADGVDQDCDGGELCYPDADLDGHAAPGGTTASADLDCDDPGEAPAPGGDCADGEPAVHPGAVEIPGDLLDADCDGHDLCWLDADGDGARSEQTVQGVGLSCGGEHEARSTALIDCDDDDPDRSPYRAEVIGDGLDQDCDGTDECYADLDGDGWRTWELVDNADADCADVGEAGQDAPAADCDDASAAVNPAAAELPGTGIDEDCDGVEWCFDDRDRDGWADTTSRPSEVDLDCDDPGEASAADPFGDCDDRDAAVNPGAADVAGDGVDADCDGGEDCVADGDLDGVLSDTPITSEDLDCDDPGEGLPGATPLDCDDADPAVAPGAVERAADGVDQDCDGTELCYRDQDGDGAGTDDVVPSGDLSCDGGGVAAAAGDCDDTDRTVGPGATEIAGDGIDQDCDGVDPAPAPPDPGTPPGPGEGDGGDPEAPKDGGCGCASGSGAGSIGILGLLAVLGALASRRAPAGCGTRQGRSKPV